MRTQDRKTEATSVKVLFLLVNESTSFLVFVVGDMLPVILRRRQLIVWRLLRVWTQCFSRQWRSERVQAALARAGKRAKIAF